MSRFSINLDRVVTVSLFSQRIIMSGHDNNWRPKVLITRKDIPTEAINILELK